MLYLIWWLTATIGLILITRIRTWFVNIFYWNKIDIYLWCQSWYLVGPHTNHALRPAQAIVTDKFLSPLPPAHRIHYISGFGAKSQNFTDILILQF